MTPAPNGPVGRWLAAIFLAALALPSYHVLSRPRASAGMEVVHEVDRAGEAMVLVTLNPRASAPGLSPRGQIDSVLGLLQPSEGAPGKRLESVPVFTARITRRGLEKLLEDPRVSRVDLDGIIRGADAVSAAQIGADHVQALSFDGSGVTVAVLDSGTDMFENPDLDPALAGEECFCSEGCCPDGTSRQSGPGAARSTSPHGPAVMGIIASQGAKAPIGIAPGSRVLMIRVLDDTLIGQLSDILAALDWVVTHAPGIRAVNLSIQAGPFASPCDSASAFNAAVAQLSENFRKAGGLFVAASGNFGTPTQLASPACVQGVVSVGAVDSSDRVAFYSDGSEALDLLAPGDMIVTDSSFGRVDVFRGTSAAAPHVTASLALLLSANATLTPDDLEGRLKTEGVPVTDSRSGLVTPRLDVFKALLLPMSVEVRPRAFSERTRGNGLTLVLRPFSPFTAADLDVASLSVSLEGGAGIPLDPSEMRLVDLDGDGVEELLTRADRRSLLSAPGGSGDSRLTVKGAYRTGPQAEGSSILRLLTPPGVARGQEPTP